MVIRVSPEEETMALWRENNGLDISGKILGSGRSQGTCTGENWTPRVQFHHFDLGEYPLSRSVIQRSSIHTSSL
jgi:hypothetical protein